MEIHAMCIYALAKLYNGNCHFTVKWQTWERKAKTNSFVVEK